MSLELPQSIIACQIPLLYLNNFLALSVGPTNQVLRLGITLPILVLLVSQSLYRQWSGGWGIHYALECLVRCCVWVYVDWNILGSPDKEKWHKVHPNGEEKKGLDNKEASSCGVRLGTGNRYVGWSCQTIRAAFFDILVDILYAYTASSPHGSWTDIAHIKSAASFSSEPFLKRLWFAWIHIVLTYVSMEQANAAYGLFSVATGLASPAECSSMFGDLRGLVCVRRAWSSVWHQQMRRIWSAPGIFLARDILHLPKGSFALKYLQLFVGFGISGIIHAGASMLTHRSFEDDGAFAVFIGQAVIIMFENHVIALGKKMGLKDSISWRVIGLVWTVFAIGTSTDRWTCNVVGHGMWVHDRKPDYFGIDPK
ncbi:hypothetical protein EK21DRAFT_101397 [Setomelanomma holmii]|uniref:Wax synthase domain-containing protein n=1 Tax=Setomelanomma holmii TaxID=210430 RepID=A0A9P4H8J0_9PLEO|nr:hypothetical protein EK21DRAFT_101397 [Setomelanomma holmii]